MTTPHIKLISRSPLRLGFIIIPLALACFALSATVRAVKPPPDGGYPGFNTAEGDKALFSLTTGLANTADGWFSLSSNTDGSFNTAVGAGTLLFNVGNQSTSEGVQNTAVGAAALLFNTTGSFNAAFGDTALLNNTTGHRNTALGSRALTANTTGFENTGLGRSALLFNTEGHDNVGIGVDAIQDNTAGINNVAIGNFALLNVTGNSNTGTGFAALGGNAQVDGTGNENTANGFNALTSNTDGNDNTAVGKDALFNNTTGDANVAVGWLAMLNNTEGTNNTAVGAGALGQNISNGNIALGTNAGANLTTGQFNIDIGNQGVADEGNTIRIGDANQTATFIAGISGTAVVGDAVVVDANGQLGTVASSARFKKQIRPMDKTSEAILGLKPVSFRYKSDSKGTPQFGLIAEEVAKVNPDLVVRDRNGEIYSVRYEAVNAMLLNEFLKEHRKNEEQEATIVCLQKQIEALTAGLQKMSAQLEANKPAPQVAANNR
jgi:trimeric autotransporter adhesin